MDPSIKSIGAIDHLFVNENTNELGLMSSSNGSNMQSISNEASKISKSNINNGRWTAQEHNKFLEALRLFGKDWNKV